MNVVAPDARIPLRPKARSDNELKNLKHEVDGVSRQENGNIFWRADRPWRKFRDHASGNAAIAGSSQADPSELSQLIDANNIGYDVDLRREPHIFVKASKGSGDRWVSVGHTNAVNWPNPGMKAKKVGQLEEKLVKHEIKKGKLSYFRISKEGTAKKMKVGVREAETEAQAIKKISKERVAAGKAPVEYARIPVTDEMPPTPGAVDKLVAVHNAAAAQGKNIYFHCDHGSGRTTTAMVLDDVMNGKSADDAVAYEAANGGRNLVQIDPADATNPIIVKASADRLGLIHRFSDYWNSDSKNRMTFKQYMKKNPIGAAYEQQMMSLLGFARSTPAPAKPASN